MAKKQCSDMIDIYYSMTSTVKHRREYAKSWLEFISAIQRVTLTQIPEAKEGLTELTSLISQLAQIHTTLALKEERSAEDLRDVYERYEIVFRASENVIRRRSQYEGAGKALTSAQSRLRTEEGQPNFEKKKQKLELAVSEAKRAKTEALDKFKAALAAVIEHKELYNKFRIRRLSHGWHLYATAIREAAEQEMDVFVKIRDHLATLDGVIDLPAGATEALAKPSPEPVAPEAVASAIQGLADLAPNEAERPKAAAPSKPAEPAPKAAPKPVEPAPKAAPKPVEPAPKAAPKPAEQAPKPVEPAPKSAPKPPEPAPVAAAPPPKVEQPPAISGWVEGPIAGWVDPPSGSDSLWDAPPRAAPVIDTGNPFDD
jgi:hypothetical protein